MAVEVDRNKSVMSSVDGISNLTIAQQIAQQNQRSAVVGANGGASPTGALFERLNALYGSDGENQALGRVGELAGRLGVDSETLMSQLQGKNAVKVNDLLTQAALLKGLEDGEVSSGSLFDTQL